jgi:hypothetical protein
MVIGSGKCDPKAGGPIHSMQVSWGGINTLFKPVHAVISNLRANCGVVGVTVLERLRGIGRA